MTNQFESSNPLALVTGASSGIGKEFAIKLASGQSAFNHKHDLIIVARNENRLNEVKEDLEFSYGVSVEVIPADLETTKGIALMKERFKDRSRSIDVLINNAGYGYSGNFGEVELKHSIGQINLNVKALVSLTYFAIESMRQSGEGYILNVSSVAGFMPAPTSAIYAATKAFVTNFSQGIREEISDTGIKLTCLCPGFTRTEFQDRANVDQRNIPGFMWQNVGQVVDAGLNGLARNHGLVTPGIHNKLLVSTTHAIPSDVLRTIAGLVARRL
ncbi:MAG: SDR family oxidoreductase [Acidimicrobiales bacterium]|nr:SDR family oxidoreductase [Acidimicrobiales bacterium]